MPHTITPHEPEEMLVSSVDEIFEDAEASQQRWQEWERKHQITLPDIGSGTLPLVASLSDKEVLALSQLQMGSKQSARFSDLLDKQQAGVLTASERSELSSLFRIYQRLWLRQSEALAEAVRRGLREPLKASC